MLFCFCLNANFISFCNLMVQFHIHRTKAIFDWIFHVPSTSNAADTKRIDNIEGSSNYELYYLSCSNIGLTSDAIEARRSHEKRGEINVRTKLAVEYTTLKGVWGFLTKNHDFYSAAKLARSGTGQDIMTGSNTLLKASYGQSSGTKTTMLAYSGGMVILSLDIFVVLALLFIIVIGLYFTIKCRQTRLDSRNDNGLKCK